MEQPSCSRISLTMTTASEIEVPWRSTVRWSAVFTLRHDKGVQGINHTWKQEVPERDDVPFGFDHDPGFVECLASRQLLEFACLSRKEQGGQQPQQPAEHRGTHPFGEIQRDFPTARSRVSSAPRFGGFSQ